MASGDLRETIQRSELGLEVRWLLRIAVAAIGIGGAPSMFADHPVSGNDLQAVLVALATLEAHHDDLASRVSELTRSVRELRP